MICWITPALGTAAYGVDRLPDDVVCADVRLLVDRAGNRPEVLSRQIHMCLDALEAGRRVVVCCDHGISRSNAVAAGVLSRWKGIALTEAVRHVLHATGGAEMRMEVVEAVRSAIGAGTPETDRVPGSRWLVTGGHGTLGRILAAEAPAGAVLLRPSHPQLDLTKGAAPLDVFVRENAVGGVIHFAAPRAANTNGSLGVALVMLRNVLDVCVANHIPALMPSRWEVFGGYKGQNLLAHEETPRLPDGVLGDTTCLMEQLVEQYVRRTGLAATVLRSGLVCGGDAAPRFVRGFIESARAGRPITTHVLANGSPKLDLVGARDWASACWGLLAAKHAGVFHCGGGHLIDTGEMARIIVTALDSRSTIGAVDIDDQAAHVRLLSDKLKGVTAWAVTEDPRRGLVELARTLVDTVRGGGEDHR